MIRFLKGDERYQVTESRSTLIPVQDEYREPNINMCRDLKIKRQIIKEAEDSSLCSKTDTMNEFLGLAHGDRG